MSMNTRRAPVPGERYRHFKGNLYQILTTAVHSETGEKLVIYQALYGEFKVYARPLDMFLEPVDQKKYPKAMQYWRFELEKPEPEADSDQKREICQGAEPEPEVCRTEETDQKQEQEKKAESGRTAMDDLMEFLDASTCRERLNILMGMSKRLDETVINNMAAAMEVTLEEGSLEKKYQSLMQCIKTRERFER